MAGFKFVIPLSFITGMVTILGHQFGVGPNNYYPFYPYLNQPSYYIPNTQITQSPHLLSSFQLPRQVRVPGRIEISVQGDKAEILCEFPRFLILFQKLHWHHRYDDPYGTYYDVNNHFSPRIRIFNEGKYKSIIRIQPFTEDDFGVWRCLSSALLPEDIILNPFQFQDPAQFPYYPSAPIYPPLNTFYHHNSLRKKRSYWPSTTTPSSVLNSLGKNVFAPFYKPNYGLFGAYLEVRFGSNRGGLVDPVNPVAGGMQNYYSQIRIASSNGEATENRNRTEVINITKNKT